MKHFLDLVWKKESSTLLGVTWPKATVVSLLLHISVSMQVFSLYVDRYILISGSTELYNTSLLINQVIKEHLYVIILFLGDNLDQGVELLVDSRRSRAKDDLSNSLLVLHYHPSSITVKHNLSGVR